MASQITSLTIVYSTVYSDADQRKHQSSASLAFVWGIHRGPVNSPYKGPVTRKMSPFDYFIMIIAFKRKSPAQIRRGNSRSKQRYEWRVTGSQTMKTDDDTVPHDISEPEMARLNDNDSRISEAHVRYCRAHFVVGSASVPLHPSRRATDLEWPCHHRGRGWVLSSTLGRRCLVSGYRIYIFVLGIIGALFSGIWYWRRWCGGYPGLNSNAEVAHDDRHTTDWYIDGSPVINKVGQGNGKPGCQNYFRTSHVFYVC